ELGLSWTTALTGALHPARRVILVCVGTGSAGKLLRSADDGETWSVVRNSDKARWVIAYDLQNPDYCYQWRERSADAGQTWVEMKNMPADAIVCGVSRSNGSIIYAMNALGGNRKKVWRSLDRG